MLTLALSANMACPCLTLALHPDIGPFQFNGLLCLFITDAFKTALLAPKAPYGKGCYPTFGKES